MLTDSSTIQRLRGMDLESPPLEGRGVGGAASDGPALQGKTASWTLKLAAACPASAATGAPVPTHPMAVFAASAPQAALSRARAVRWQHAPSLPVPSSCSAACDSASTSRCPSRRCPPRVTERLSTVPTYVTLTQIATCQILRFSLDTVLFPHPCWGILESLHWNIPCYSFVLA